MDPISIIVSAFVAGIAASITDTTKSAVKDLYEVLKARLITEVDGNPNAQEALKMVEQKPESEARQMLLKEELTELKIDYDVEILKLAKSILERLDAQEIKPEKYRIEIDNSQNIVIGDKPTVTQSTTTSPKRGHSKLG